MISTLLATDQCECVKCNPSAAISRQNAQKIFAEEDEQCKTVRVQCDRQEGHRSSSKYAA